MSKKLEKWYVWDKKTKVGSIAGIIQNGKKMTVKGDAILHPRNSTVLKTVIAYTKGELAESKRKEKSK